MISKGIILIGLLSLRLVASDSLSDICFKQDNLKRIDIKDKTIYKYDFDSDNKIDKISIDEEYLIIDMKNKHIKESVSKICDVECSYTIVTKKYLCLGDMGTDFGNIYVYKYDGLYKNWFNIGGINKSPNDISHDYKEIYYSNLWTIDKKIYKIKGRDTLLSLYQDIIDLYKNKEFSTLKALVKSVSLEHLNIEKSNLTTYNNIAYYLQKAGANEEAVYLLEKIIKKYPKRTVAYYNLGDAYWALGDKKKAKKVYEIYIKQMKQKGKQKQIPKVIKDRV